MRRPADFGAAGSCAICSAGSAQISRLWGAGHRDRDWPGRAGGPGGFCCLLGLKRQVNEIGNRPRGTSLVTVEAGSDGGYLLHAWVAPSFGAAVRCLPLALTKEIKGWYCQGSRDVVVVSSLARWPEAPMVCTDHARGTRRADAVMMHELAASPPGRRRLGACSTSQPGGFHEDLGSDGTPAGTARGAR